MASLLLTLIVFCTGVASSGYEALPDYHIGIYEEGPPEYYSENHHDKAECKKLKHFDIQRPFIVNHEAKFSSLTRNGKHYIKISCPNDFNQYVLVAEKSGSVARIRRTDFQDTVILATGVNFQFLARCDGKRIKSTTYTEKYIKIEKVSCVYYGPSLLI